MKPQNRQFSLRAFCDPPSMGLQACPRGSRNLMIKKIKGYWREKRENLIKNSGSLGDYPSCIWNINEYNLII
jgi:hypothetical protein